MPKINIVNIVLSGHIHRFIPLDLIASKVENVQYNPEEFPGLIIRLKDPKTTIILFSTGKIGLTGCLPKMRIERVISTINIEFKKINFKLPSKIDFNIENIVAMIDIGFKLNLDKVGIILKDFEYDPHQFPGIIYRISNFIMCFLIFSSGKIIIVGAKNNKELREQTEKLLNILKVLKPNKIHKK